jgi:predicted dithiol-disulfide oxidoreductase (DUF899 family)
MHEPKYSFKPTGQVSAFNFKPDYNISFHNNGQEIGKLDFNGPKMVFTGDAEESAKVFIDWVARSFHGRLEEERKAEREACLNCYSPDDTATDWADKIRARENT